MNTKKAISAWWEGLGEEKPTDDRAAFKNLISEPCAVLEEQHGSRFIVSVATVTSPRWKYPLKLYFDASGECYRIAGF